MNTISERLDLALKAKNKTKGRMAKDIKVHASTIDNYLKGKVDNPNPLILDKIADYLEVNRSWLILGMGEMKKPKIVGDNGFNELNIDAKLNKLYSMLTVLKKGQDSIMEIVYKNED